MIVLIFGGVKKSRRPRQEPPRAAGTEPARPLENIFQERRIVKVFCISNTPLVPVGTVADFFFLYMSVLELLYSTSLPG